MDDQTPDNRSPLLSPPGPASSSPKRASKKKSSSASSASASRQHKARPVIYKSSNLANTAPNLVAQTNPETVSAVRAIREANAVAERVREDYRRASDPSQLGEAIEGNDDESNAKKYERRLKMNRKSAAASRVRREAYTKALEAEIVKMERDYNKVVRALRRERAECNRLTRLVTGSVHSDDSDIDELPDIMPRSDHFIDHSSVPVASASAPAIVTNPTSDQPPAELSKTPSSSAMAKAVSFPNASAPEIVIGAKSGSDGNTIALPQTNTSALPAPNPFTPQQQVVTPPAPITVPVDFGSLADTSLEAVLAAGSTHGPNTGATNTAVPNTIPFDADMVPDFLDQMQAMPSGQFFENDEVSSDLRLARELRLSPEAIDSLGARSDAPIPTCFMTLEEMCLFGSDNLN